MLRLIVFLSIVSCTFGASFRIVGGNIASQDEIPYIVSITYAGRQFCGGTLIKPDTVITAAHCTINRRLLYFLVYAGTQFHNEGESREVKEIIQHEYFRTYNLDNDISIMKLFESFTINNFIKPINLPTKNEEFEDGTTGTVSGWGRTYEWGQISKELRYADVQTVSYTRCYKKYSMYLTRRMLCAENPGKDSCQGDSGGPLVINGKLAGIISWGFGCADRNYPGVYTKVSEFTDWILLKLQ